MITVGPYRPASASRTWLAGRPEPAQPLHLPPAGRRGRPAHRSRAAGAPGLAGAAAAAARHRWRRPTGQRPRHRPRRHRPARSAGDLLPGHDRPRPQRVLALAAALADHAGYNGSWTVRGCRHRAPRRHRRQPRRGPARPVRPVLSGGGVPAGDNVDHRRAGRHPRRGRRAAAAAAAAGPRRGRGAPADPDRPRPGPGRNRHAVSTDQVPLAGPPVGPRAGVHVGPATCRAAAIRCRC